MEDEYVEEYDPDTKEKNVYSKKAREELVENDEISAEEEGFMAGYESEDEDEDEDEDSEDKTEEEKEESLKID